MSAGEVVKVAQHKNVTRATIAELRKQWIANPAMPPYQRLTLGSICDIADAALRDAALNNYASLKGALNQMLGAFELGCSLHPITIEELRAAYNAWFTLKKAERK